MQLKTGNILQAMANDAKCSELGCTHAWVCIRYMDVGVARKVLSQLASRLAIPCRFNSPKSVATIILQVKRVTQELYTVKTFCC